MNLISPAHKISKENRGLRDLMRMRLRLVHKRTSCYNSIHRIAEKFNCDTEINLREETIPEILPEEYKLQAKFLYAQVELLNEQIKELEKTLQPMLKLLGYNFFSEIVLFLYYFLNCKPIYIKIKWGE